MRNCRQILLMLLGVLMLASCSLFTPAKVNPPHQYLIDKMPCVIPQKAKRRIVLLVSLPETRPVYNTTQMAYSVSPYLISYYGLNQWAEVPGDMFQPLLVETMQKTNHFKAVVTPPYNGVYDYTLNTEILELLQDYTCRSPVLRMTVRAQIIKASSNRVIGTRQFLIEQPMRQCSPYGGVFAANAVSAMILTEIAGFALEVIR